MTSEGGSLTKRNRSLHILYKFYLRSTEELVPQGRICMGRRFRGALSYSGSVRVAEVMLSGGSENDLPGPKAAFSHLLPALRITSCQPSSHVIRASSPNTVHLPLGDP